MTQTQTDFHRRARRFAPSIAGAITLYLLAHSIAAYADTATGSDAPQLQEIVVTAQKRETNLQQTPIAVTTVQSDELVSRDLRDIQALSFSVPGLVYAESVAQQQITIRGIGDAIPNASGEPGVAFHVDGVYMGNLNDSTAAFDELERVEVLRGPQGTLYGRNATGGAINLVTKLPTFQPEGYVSVLYGNYDRVETRGAISGPITDSAAGRISASYETRNGYALNEHDNQRIDDAHRSSVRGSVLIQPMDALRIVLRGDFSRDHFTGMPDKPLGVGNPNAGFDTIQNLPGLGRYVIDPRIVFLDYPDRIDRQIWGLSGTVEYDFGPVKLKSISATRDVIMPDTIDSDGYEVLLFDIANTNSGRQYSQEFQLASAYQGPIQFIVGAFYFDLAGELGINALFPGPGGATFPYAVAATQKTKSYAEFGELYYNFDDSLKLTLGGRYTSDHKSFENTFGVFNSRDFTEFTPKIGLEKKVTPDLFAYASISRGFKSGGFNIFDATGRSFAPEKVTAYETGLKSEFYDKRVRFNTSVFYYQYKDMQVTQFPGDGSQFVDNAASSKIYGADLEITALPCRYLKLDSSISLLHARFEKFITADLLNPTGPLRDLASDSLINSPRFVGNLGAELILPVIDKGTASLRGEVSHSSEYFFTVFNREPAVQSAYTMYNAFASFSTSGKGWKFDLFGRNLGNKNVLASAFETPRVGTFLAPRTFGASVQKNF
jgi:iron complex outermembrane receptor protein